MIDHLTRVTTCFCVSRYMNNGKLRVIVHVSRVMTKHRHYRVLSLLLIIIIMIIVIIIPQKKWNTYNMFLSYYETFHFTAEPMTPSLLPPSFLHTARNKASP